MKQPASKRKTDINIVPLIDVLIVLIFFFLISMQFRNQSVLNITVPKIETAGKNEVYDQIEITVQKEGQYSFNGVTVEEKELLSSIQLIAKVNPKQPVLVIADEESALKHVTFIIDKCRQAKLEQIRLQAR